MAQKEVAMKVYFGHPVNTYNTELEEHLLTVLPRLFPGSVIENPNQPHHQDGYQRYKRERRSGMPYFYEEVLPLCDEGVFLPFGDGAWGAGVYGEAQFLFDRGKKVWVILNRAFWEHGATMLLVQTLDNVTVLTPEETRLRVYGPEGMRPYA